MFLERFANRHLEPPIRNVVRLALYPIMTSGARMVEYSGLENLEKLESLLDEHTLLVIATSHSSHSDILPGIKMVDEVRSRFPRIRNFYIPIAASLVRGVQGLRAQLLYSEGTLPLLNQSNIIPLATITENDHIKRGLNRSIRETSLLLKAVKEDQSAILVLTEGSVESGRRDILGNPRGIQEVKNPFLPTIFERAIKTEKKVAILPVGISGTTRMLSAESIFFTWETIGAFARDWNRILRRPAILATATVGSPYEFPYEIDMRRNPQAVNETVMQSIASLMPPKLRGYYYPPARAYQEAMREFENQLEKDERRLIKYHLAYREELRQLAIQYSQIK